MKTLSIVITKEPRLVTSFTSPVFYLQKIKKINLFSIFSLSCWSKFVKRPNTRTLPSASEKSCRCCVCFASLVTGTGVLAHLPVAIICSSVRLGYKSRVAVTQRQVTRKCVTWCRVEALARPFERGSRTRGARGTARRWRQSSHSEAPCVWRHYLASRGGYRR